MNISLIAGTVAAIIVSLGGASVIILAVVHFSSDIIAERLQSKYQLKLDKEIEKYKSELESKIYISNARFDAEFSIYRNLSKVFIEMIKGVNLIIPPGIYNPPSNPDEYKELDYENYEAASKAIINAQDSLYENAAFIPEEIYNIYEELLKISKNQLFIFEDSLCNADRTGPGSEEFRVKLEDHRRSRDLNNKFHELNIKIREYLSKLNVL